MSLEFIQRGTRAEITGGEAPYVTTVDSILENGRVLLNTMRHGGEEKRLEAGGKYTLKFFSDLGIFKFASALRTHMMKGQNEYMLFQTTDYGERIQRRRSFRLPCGENVTFDLVVDFEGNTTTHKGFIRDISSGGVRLLTDMKLDKTQIMYLRLPMVEPDFWVFGSILSSKSIKEAKYRRQYGVEFIGVTESDFDKLIDFVENERQKSTARN